MSTRGKENDYITHSTIVALQYEMHYPGPQTICTELCHVSLCFLRHHAE